MMLLIVLTLISLSYAQLSNYNDFLTFAAKNHYKYVSDYAIDIGFINFIEQFNQFKREYSKRYSPGEEQLRQFNFLKTLQFIEKHNQKFRNGEETHEVGITSFADKTTDEYEKLLNTPQTAYNMSMVPSYEPDFTLYTNLPPTFDWRDHYKVTSIKNQGRCGSCWAFATVATIESAYLIKYGHSISLSEQQLVDCSSIGKYKNLGCGGGYLGEALLYSQEIGIESETEYPYRGVKSQCLNSETRSHTKLVGYRRIYHPSDLDIMSAIFNFGPVAVRINSNGTEFMNYKRGIISTEIKPVGNAKTNHDVAVIGWGSENNTDYWIVKNSWGAQWGERGFVRMIRGKNIRSFNEDLYYPLL